MSVSPEYQKANPACPWCGNLHGQTRCPLVKRFELYHDGTVKSVEFHDSETATRLSRPRPDLPSRGT